jgi:hypothetical protein
MAAPSFIECLMETLGASIATAVGPRYRSRVVLEEEKRRVVVPGNDA